MNTISLIKFECNENTTGINNGIGEDITFLLRPCFIKVFEEVVGKFKNGIYNDFVKKVWMPACNIGEMMAEDTLKQLGSRHNVKFNQNDIEKVIRKFRGNLGEIFAELYFTSGKCSICNLNKYIPIDPFNEDYTDAESEHINTKLPIYIQVKNFESIKIDRTIFDKAESMFAQKLYRPKSVICFDDRNKYIDIPHQIIFSMTNVSDNRILKDYSGHVIFIGPNEINDAEFQGNSKKNLQPAIGRFEDIIKEITLFS